MKIEEILTLMEGVKKNDLTTFSYKEEDTELYIEKKGQDKFVYETAGRVAEVSLPESKVPVSDTQISSDHVVTSPLVGTFYVAASPEAKPYVQVGDTVKKGQVIGIIEAMKLMNEVESDFDGVVEDILVDDKSTVEYGQALFRIR